MNDPVRFLQALGQALSVMTLYPEGHPSRERLADNAYDALLELAADVPPAFTFLEGEVIAGRERVADLRNWEWSTRLADAGIGRLEFSRSINREEFEGLLQELHLHLFPAPVESSDRRQMRDLGVRFGAVSVAAGSGTGTGDGTGGGGGWGFGAGGAGGAGGASDLTAEVETLAWIHEEVSAGRALPLLEAESIVRSLAVAMHLDAGMLLPLLQLKEFDQYTTTHSLNVAVLSMALAETLGLTATEVRAVGVSGLLHDVGKTRIPHAVLVKPGRLSPDETALMQRHPVDGARIILHGDADLELAAVVAYEHHIRIDGGGYPSLHYHRDCALGSRLVHVCDVFDALSTRRPYREAWPVTQTLAYLEDVTRREFDPALVTSFARLMRDESTRVERLDATGSGDAALGE